jgi:hypothetical protein
MLDWHEGGLDRSSVAAIIDADSVDTNVPLLDKLVKGADMFDVARFAQIRFVSKRFERTGDARGTLTGDLTIRGTSQPVTLDVTFNGFAPDPLTKKDTLGFSAEGHFSRARFGLSTWFPAVGDDVNVRIQAEFVRQSAAPGRAADVPDVSFRRGTDGPVWIGLPGSACRVRLGAQPRTRRATHHPRSQGHHFRVGQSICSALKTRAAET